MKSLDDLIQSVSNSGHMGAEDRQPPPPGDLLFYAPCPVKLAVKDALDALADALADAHAGDGDALAVHIPMGCTSVDPYDPLHRETDPDHLPQIIASIGFGDFFRRGFVERFVDAGVFAAPQPEGVTPMHRAAGIVDPDGRYLVYGLTPYIFLIDRKRLGDLPVPRRWADLLDPIYAGQVNMCGDGDDMADAVLLSIHKDFGMQGIARFAANTRGLMHSSRMAKSGGAPQAGGIYILPYFFAETTRQPDHMQTVWPEDGAAASPLYMLAKRTARPRLDRLIDFFATGFGQIESARWFLPLTGPLPQSLPPGAAIKWIGWDYIRATDITALRDRLNGEFRLLVKARAEQGTGGTGGAACAS